VAGVAVVERPTITLHPLTTNSQDSTTALAREWPAWTRYGATLALEAALTLLLIRLHPYVPLADYPMPYIVLIMVVAYLFGEGPAVFAVVAGLVMFDYFFLPPTYGFWPIAEKREDWAKVLAFFLGASIVGFATIMMRRSNRRIQRLARELERQKALLETFTQNVPVGLALLDLDARYVIVNDTLAGAVGKCVEEMVNKPASEVLPPDLAAHTDQAVRTVFATGEPHIKRDLATSVGSERYFDVAHYPVRTSGGEILGVGAVVVETTERVQARETLQVQYDREHRIADILQTSLLGEVTKRVRPFEFETLYRAALDEARIGGDFYDVFELSEERVAVVIGDVSGKGLSAAVQVAMARCNVRGRLYDHHDPALAMQQVNNTLVREMASEAFVTMFVGVLDRPSRSLTYANAGHEPVILWRAESKEAAMLLPTGPIVGMQFDCPYDSETVTLDPGDEVLLGTDGLCEVKCSYGFMGVDELIRIYSELKRARQFSASELVDEVIRICGNDLRDDVAVLRVGVSE